MLKRNKMATAVRVTSPCPLIKMIGVVSFAIVKEIRTSLVEYIWIPTFSLFGFEILL